jgi:peptidoglycan hydrolase-like protein with peptidoglycan-binding domain
MRQGDRGENVKALQEDLVLLGSDIIPDGIFGFDTTRAVKEFQAKFNLTQDGIVGPITEGAIRSIRAGGSLPTKQTVGSPLPREIPSWMLIAGISLAVYFGYTMLRDRG